MTSRAARKVSYDQPGLFPAEQPDLFDEAPAPRRDVYIPKAEAVRSGCRRVVEEFQSLQAWADVHAWKRIRFFERAEYYYGITADDAEAEEWRARYEAEIARLDATGPRQPEGERAEYTNYPTRAFAPNWVRRPPGR